MSVKEPRLSHLFAHSSPQNFLNETQFATDTGDEVCDNFTFQFTHHNNDSNSRGVQTEEKLYNVVRLRA